MRIRHVMEGEERLVFASLAAIPFLVVVDFDRSSTTFSLTSDRNAAIVVQAIMSVAMEFTVALIFLAAGFVAPAIPRSMVKPGRDTTLSERQVQRHYGGLASRDNSPGATYPLTGAAPSYAGHKQGQQNGVTGGYTDREVFSMRNPLRDENMGRRSGY